MVNEERELLDAKNCQRRDREEGIDVGLYSIER